jgi:hypothetical protein
VAVVGRGGEKDKGRGGREEWVISHFSRMQNVSVRISRSANRDNFALLREMQNL